MTAALRLHQYAGGLCTLSSLLPPFCNFMTSLVPLASTRRETTKSDPPYCHSLRPLLLSGAQIPFAGGIINRRDSTPMPSRRKKRKREREGREETSCHSQPYLPILISTSSEDSCRPPILEHTSEVANVQDTPRGTVLHSLLTALSFLRSCFRTSCIGPPKNNLRMPIRSWCQCGVGPVVASENQPEPANGGGQRQAANQGTNARGKGNR